MEKNENKEEQLLFLKSIVDSVPIMIFVKEVKELRFILFNKAGEELLGYNAQDMLGKNDYDFFPKEQAEFFIAKDRLVLESKKLLDIPKESINTKNKGVRILHTQKIPILAENGEAKYLLGISEDITEKERIEISLQEKFSELEKINQAMIDREIKMVELKNKIKELEQKYGK